MLLGVVADVHASNKVNHGVKATSKDAISITIDVFIYASP
jgi:hypothetical protein